MYVHTSFDTYSDRHVLGLLLCAGVVAMCCAVLVVLYTDIQRQRTCSCKYNEKTQEWNGMTDVVDGPTFKVQAGDLQMPRAPCSRKTTRTPHACTYIPGTSFDMYCDRQVLGLLLCAGVIALFCARGTAVDTERQHIYPKRVMLFATPVS